MSGKDQRQRERPGRPFSERQNQAADIGNDAAAVAGGEEEQDADTQTHKCLQHVGAALQGAVFQHLRFVGE